MPKNNVMISNKAALEAGIDRAAWKLEMGAEYFFNTVKYDISKLGFFDHRELRTVAAMLIDISPVANESEDVKREYYLGKLQVFEQEFLLSKDPEAKNRLLKKIYEEIATDIDIDWDNPAEIDHIACSLRVQQVLGTIADNTPQDVLKVYNTVAEAKRLDNISLKNMVSLGVFQNALVEQCPEIASKITAGVNFDDYAYRFRNDVVNAFVKANEDGTNVATFDPNTSETFKRHFLGDEFDLVFTKRDTNPQAEPGTMIEEHYTSDEAAKNFMEYIYTMADGTVNEHIVMSGYLKGHSKEEMLFINGRPMSEIIAEQETVHANDPTPRKTALISAGRILRDALTDGTSVVSLMRPYLVEGGKVAFNHQEIKVDLDKLNKIERQEKHNIFRRMLHSIGIRIPNKYASNQERERNQSAIKGNSEYQAALKTAEKKFIDAYNKNSREKLDEETRKLNDPNRKKPVVKDPLYNTCPEISAANPDSELDVLNESLYNDSEKVRLTSLFKDLEEDKDFEFSEPIDEEELDKSKEFEPNVK